MQIKLTSAKKRYRLYLNPMEVKKKRLSLDYIIEVSMVVDVHDKESKYIAIYDIFGKEITNPEKKERVLKIFKEGLSKNG